MRARRALPALHLLWRVGMLVVLLQQCAGSAPAAGGGTSPVAPDPASNASTGAAAAGATGQAGQAGTEGPACADGACAAAAAAAGSPAPTDAAAGQPSPVPNGTAQPADSSVLQPSNPAEAAQAGSQSSGSAAGQAAGIAAAHAAPGAAAASEVAAAEPAAAGAVGTEQPAAAAVSDSGADAAAATAGATPPAEAPAQPAVPPETASEPALEQQHNFALAKEGAKVLAFNKEAKKAGALLDDDSDTFLKNECRAADKWVIFELSQVARISRLELAQFELYSARVKEFSAHGRQSHPRTDGFGTDYARTLNSSQWKLLGNFTAEKAKGSQVFAVPRPRWVRYLLLRFLTQHGPEPVCAVNGVSVFGKSAVEELEDQLASELREEEEGLGLLPLPADAAPIAAAAGPAGPAATAAGAPGEAAAVLPSEPGAVVDAGEVAAPAQPIAATQEQPADEAAAGGAQQDEAEESGGTGTCVVEQEQPVAGTSSGEAEEAHPSAGPCNTTAPAAKPQAEGTAGSIDAPSSQTQQPAAAVVPPPPAEPAAAQGGSAAGAAFGQPAENASAAGTAAARQHSSSQAAQQPAATPAASQQAQLQQQQAQQQAQQPRPNPSQPGQQQAAGSTLANAGAAVVHATAGVTPGAAAPAGQPTQQQAQQPAAAGAAVPVTPPNGRLGAAATPTPKQPANGKPAGNGNGAAAAAQAPQPDGPPRQEPLDLPLAIAAKGKGGGSVYDILVQEIKAAKLQQKLLVKSVAELQRNSSGTHAELAGDIASLAARLAKLPSESNLSEEALAARVDTLVKAHLLQVTSHMLALQTALASAAKQQHALLCFLAMLGGVLALNGTRFAEQWPRVKWAVLLLAAANGLVGVALQLQGGMARQPHWMQALPWGGNAPGGAQ